MQSDNRYGQLDERLFHRQQPSPLSNPVAVHFNHDLADRLQWTARDPSDWVPIVAGQVVPPEFDPLAMAYAGHQFGHWAGQLGDGRGLLLGQIRDQSGQLIDLHLKGAGQTPYSRMGDGRAVLRSTIREYLAGHAMTALGVPSSQSLAIVTSDTPVQRETLERGATLLRVADSHVRFGHFEWINRYVPEALESFTQWVMETYFPDVLLASEPLLALADAVVQRTAKMIADWQAVGFAHGVMNTDNMSITGATLDYGPYGFMERFNPHWISNHSDEQGRYTYHHQPLIGRWNLGVWLAQLLPLGINRDDLKAILGRYDNYFADHYTQRIAAKLGLSFDPLVVPLMTQLAQLMQRHQLDYTATFRTLTDDPEALSRTLADDPEWGAFWALYREARLPNPTTMSTSNPIYILRNTMAQAAIERAEQGDCREVARLFDLLSTPFDEQPERERLTDRNPLPPDHPVCEVSCSS